MKCPFCAEEIQEEAVKCRFCKEFLVMRPETVQVPWYGKPMFLIASFLTVGPFALPFVWFHPTYSRRTKIVVTVIVLILSSVLFWAVFRSAKTVYDYYKQVGIL
ncbi:MAG: zinc ribbon domain-containing protein [Candidatus Omnitrophota bacterium]